MARCSFCREVIEKGTGKIFVKTDGKILNFCSNKCEKNMLKLKRKPRDTKWTKEYQNIKKEGRGEKK
jgi:large subunit ribosomal protein L24e